MQKYFRVVFEFHRAASKSLSNMPAISSLEVLQDSSRNGSVFKSNYVVFNFSAILAQNNFTHVMT